MRPWRCWPRRASRWGWRASGCGRCAPSTPKATRWSCLSSGRPPRTPRSRRGIGRVLVELCRHLDGIPLAIELAAARVRSMCPAEILARLGDRLRLLRGGARGGLDRHRTLAATLDWSYGLLSATERALLDRFAVFAGTFDLAAVEAVCADEVVDALDVVELVSGLVDKSMVVADRSVDGNPVSVIGDGAPLQRGPPRPTGTRSANCVDRHLDALPRGGRDGAGRRTCDDYTSGRVVFDREWDNLRAATNHALARRDSDGPGPDVRRCGASTPPSRAALRGPRLGDAGRRAARCPSGDVRRRQRRWPRTLGRFDEAERLARAGIAAATDPLDSTDRSSAGRRSSSSPTAPASFAPRYEAVLAAHQTASRRCGVSTATRCFRRSSRRGIVSMSTSIAAAAGPQRAETLIASAPQPDLSRDVLATLASYHERTGDPAAGSTTAEKPSRSPTTHDLPRTRSLARITLARLYATGGLDDPTPAFRDAIAGAYTDRAWNHLWHASRDLAEWWADPRPTRCRRRRRRPPRRPPHRIRRPADPSLTRTPFPTPTVSAPSEPPWTATNSSPTSSNTSPPSRNHLRRSLPATARTADPDHSNYLGGRAATCRVPDRPRQNVACHGWTPVTGSSPGVDPGLVRRARRPGPRLGAGRRCTQCSCPAVRRGTCWGVA